MSLQAPLKNRLDDIVATQNYAHHKNKCILDLAVSGTGKIIFSNVNFTNFVYETHFSEHLLVQQ